LFALTQKADKDMLKKQEEQNRRRSIAVEAGGENLARHLRHVSSMGLSGTTQDTRRMGLSGDEDLSALEAMTM